MNFVTQIVPGLRDTRVPLAIGVIYAMIIWIIFPTLPPGPGVAFVQDLVAQWQALPEVVAFAAGAFAIYILGLLLELIGRIALWLTGILLAVQIMVALGTAVASAILSPAIAVALVLLAVVASYHLVVWRLSRLSMGVYLPSVGHGCVAAIAGLADHIFFQPLVGGRRSVPEDRLDDELDRALRGDESLIRALVNQVSNEFIARTIAVGRKKVNDSVLKNVPRRYGQFRFHRVLAFMNSDEQASEQIRRDYGDYLLEPQAARTSFAHRCLNIWNIHEELQKRLDRTEVKLQAFKQDQFSEFDRLRAEGELRRGLSLPVGLLLASVVIRWHEYGNSTLATTFGVAAAVLGITFVVFYALGSYKMKRARAWAYDCYNEEVVPLNDSAPISTLLAARSIAMPPYRIFDEEYAAGSRLIQWLKSRKASLSRSNRSTGAGSKERSATFRKPKTADRIDGPG